MESIGIIVLSLCFIVYGWLDIRCIKSLYKMLAETNKELENLKTKAK